MKSSKAKKILRNYQTFSASENHYEALQIGIDAIEQVERIEEIINYWKHEDHNLNCLESIDQILKMGTNN